MAKKRRNRSRDYIEDVPIGALLILLFAAWSYIKEFWYIFLIIAVAVIAVVILIKVKKKKRKKVFAIDEIDAMDGIDFEDYTAGLLRRMGYRNVRVTQASGDFGVDVTAQLNDELWVPERQSTAPIKLSSSRTHILPRLPRNLPMIRMSCFGTETICAAP